MLWVAALLLLTVAAPGAASESRENASPSASLPADQIIAKAVELADRLRKQKQGLRYEFVEQVITEQFSTAGRVKQREEVLAKIYPLQGALYREIIGKNGKPLSAEEAAAERRRKDEVLRRRARGEKNNENGVQFNRELVGRYRAKLLVERLVRGRPTYAISFEPKSDSLPVRRRIDYALNKSRGWIFVDKETFQVARVEFQLIEPVSLWWGLLGKLRAVKGFVERAPLADGAWVGRRLDFSMNMRIFFKNVHTRRRAEFRDHRRAAGHDQGEPSTL